MPVNLVRFLSTRAIGWKTARGRLVGRWTLAVCKWNDHYACQTTLLLRDSLSLSRSFLLWLQPWSLSTIMLLWHSFLIIIIIIIITRNKFCGTRSLSNATFFYLEQAQRDVHPVQNLLLCTKFLSKSDDFCCAMLCMRRLLPACCVRLSVCPFVHPSVRPSVTFVSCAKTTKDIFEIFAPSGSQAILVCFIPNGVALFWREPR